MCRTHRERKEQYIKALEQEVLRLKDAFADSTRERDKVLEENKRLKSLLAQHGISYDFGESPVQFRRENSGYGPSSSGSISGSYQPASDSTGLSPPAVNGQLLQMPQQQTQSQQGAGMQPLQVSGSMSQLPSNQLNYDQIGVDFVLTYDSQGRPAQRAPPYPSPPPQRS